jgi:hypothetical protein
MTAVAFPCFATPPGPRPRVESVFFPVCGIVHPFHEGFFGALFRVLGLPRRNGVRLQLADSDADEFDGDDDDAHVGDRRAGGNRRRVERIERQDRGRRAHEQRRDHGDARTERTHARDLHPPRLVPDQRPADIYRQMQEDPEIEPRSGRRTPIHRVVVTNGDLDGTLGLFSSRESTPFDEPSELLGRAGPTR